jgi:hypothetical protein
MEIARWPRRSILRLGLMVSCLFVVVTASIAAAPGGLDTRSAKSLTTSSATYPTIISDHACAVSPTNQRIYCFGGVDTVTTNAPETDLIVEYDPEQLDRSHLLLRWPRPGFRVHRVGR